MKKLTLLIIGLLLCGQAYSATSYEATVTDISNDAYKNTVIELIDNATSSITISMFIISANTEEVTPLINSLSNALDRGLKINIWLNTSKVFNQKYKRTKEIKALAKKGANIYEVKTGHVMHQKLIIIDKYYIIEGSTNWSAKGLTDNIESATLIQCPGLAKEKIAQLKKLPLIGEPKQEYIKPKYTPDPTQTMPEYITLSKTLLTNKKYLPTMMRTKNNRSFDIYFLLVRESYMRNKQTFFINLEYMADLLVMDHSWSDSTKRRQIIKTLKNLSNKYKLIEIDLTYSKDAKIKIIPIEGEQFTAESTTISPSILNEYSPAASLMSLIEECLKTEGASLNEFTHKEITRRFHISKDAQIDSR